MAIASKPKPKRKAAHHHKRHGTHQKRNNHFMKAYWPYLPLLFIVGVGIFVNSLLSRPATLGYATQTSINGLLESTNEERSAHNLNSLTLNSSLANAAQAKADDMVARDYWSHQTPEHNDPWIFIKHTGYTYQSAGENLAYGFDSSKGTTMGWMNSPEHRANILNTNYSEVGFGIAQSANYQNKGEQTVVVAFYAKPGAATAQLASQPLTEAPPANNAAGNVSATVPEQQVSRIELVANGSAPWSLFAISAGVTILLIVFITRHGFAWHRMWVRGEAFVLKHKFLDVIIVSSIMVGYILSRTVGVIQ